MSNVVQVRKFNVSLYRLTGCALGIVNLNGRPARKFIQLVDDYRPGNRDILRECQFHAYDFFMTALIENDVRLLKKARDYKIHDNLKRLDLDQITFTVKFKPSEEFKKLVDKIPADCYVAPRSLLHNLATQLQRDVESVQNFSLELNVSSDSDFFGELYES